MRKLILVKHSVPQMDPNIPASRWHLSEEGRRRCVILAAKLAAHTPDCLISSTEPKAAETAEIVANALGKSWRTAEGLHEQDRRHAGFLSTEEFEAALRRLFEHPQQLVFGQETADQAHRRFGEAVAEAAHCCGARNITIFAHGTVIALFVARAAGLDPFDLWKRLGLPAFVVMSLPNLQVLEIVEGSELLLEQP